MLGRIAENFKMRSWWSEYLDLATIRADIFVQTQQSGLATGAQILELGQALEACKQFQAAPEMFGHVPDEYASDPYTMVCACLEQANAYHNIYGLVNTEAAYLRGLRALFLMDPVNALDHRLFNSFISGLSQTYF
jgi:hypothetical protein